MRVVRNLWLVLGFGLCVVGCGVPAESPQAEQPSQPAEEAAAPIPSPVVEAAPTDAEVAQTVAPTPELAVAEAEAADPLPTKVTVVAPPSPSAAIPAEEPKPPKTLACVKDADCAVMDYSGCRYSCCQAWPTTRRHAQAHTRWRQAHCGPAPRSGWCAKVKCARKPYYKAKARCSQGPRGVGVCVLASALRP